jgi:hypothetical protein
VELTIISATIGIAIALACAWYCRRVALEKGRNAVLWAVLGFALTVIAVPVLVLLPVTATAATAHAPAAEGGESTPADPDA